MKVTAVGGEDSISNLHFTPLVGAMRTYVRTPDGLLTMDGWFGALRNGHAFVTNGPLVELTVQGRIAGETVRLDEGTRSVSVEAGVRSITPLTRVWLVQDGEDIQEIPLSADRRSATFSGDVSIDGSGWIHLRAEGDPEERFPLDAAYAQAFTNPVWISVGGQPVRSAEAADYGLAWIDELRRQAEDWPGWRSQSEKDHVYAQFDEARASYRSLRAESTSPGS